MIDSIRRKPTVVAASIAITFAIAAGRANAEQLGECYRANIPAPIVLPDNSLHPAGELQVCMTWRLSPVEWLHVVSINGEALGEFRGRDGHGGRVTESTQSQIVLLKQADGSLRLFGFTTGDVAGARLHRFVREGVLRV